MNPYEQQLVDLREGKISEIKVPHDQFFLFREAWVNVDDRKFFRGIATLGGDITYVYDTSVV